MQITRHAEQRSIQRNIPREVMEAVYAYGSARHVRGAESLTYDRNSHELACDGDSRLNHRYKSYIGVFVIVGEDSKIVTVARSNRRFRK
jgi:hypothetical protein